MTAASDPTPRPAPELVMSRIFAAPRALVFRAWTDPAHAVRWWGPADFPATHLEMDVRPGGRWRGCLTGVKDGRELWQGGEFREVEAPARLVFTFSWDEEGERGQETLVTITFTEQDGGTLMDFRQAPFQSVGERDSHRHGWGSMFDRFDAFLANED